MKRIERMRIMLIGISVMILTCVALWVWVQNAKSQENVIHVHLREDTVQIVEFDHLTLIPGESCNYTVSVSSTKGKAYDLMLQFVETEEKTLKNFAYVRIESGGEIVYEQLLKDAFRDDALVLPVDFSENRNVELDVTYYMPVEVGNEAENAEAIFELRIAAGNE